ncbi:ubiquitin-conjugating enzyme E2 G1 [Coemansia sp. RSA 720]|nr:ubiquitin-conjugating enzyme E2 G1 [Coemansia sp. RSA 720]
MTDGANFSGAATILLRQLKGNENSGFSVGLEDENNIFEAMTLFGPPDTYYEGGMFKAILKFPHDFPFNPPTMRFTSKLWHPNVYEDGRVCISILHTPVEDSSGYEDVSERWSAARSIESILVSVIAMLSSPNDESAANVDAAKMWRDDKPLYKKTVQRCVEKSMED